MRRLASVLALLAACDSAPDQGATLTFETPGGPMTATRIEVVLANAKTDTISDVDNQRREPGSGAEDAVRYYRQRAKGGAVDGMSSISGFKLRIEPDATTSTDEEFVPFVFVYNGDALIGVGAVEDASGDPSAVQIAPKVMTGYTVTVTAVQTVDADAAIDRGKARIVRCTNERSAPWDSGIAWFPVADPVRPNGRAHQLRLLLPDVGADPAATDATMREADLDCDDHRAEANDCDDLRGAFHDGAAESCDGLDTNCDQARFTPQGCTQSSGTCSVAGSGGGIQICDDAEGTLGACTPSAACLCAGGNPGCSKCLVDFTGAAASRAPCTPSIGFVKLPMCEGTTGCRVEVLGATNGWRAYISTMNSGGFTTTLDGVHFGVFLEAKLGNTLPFTQGSIGEVYLRITASQGPFLLPIQMEMSASTVGCTPASGGFGSKMTCLP
ncbi:MAG: putative metal-binding motif-containing protein [Deltaproteobacteria bacterium]|nr:putative metal-binding motif-containing protein [Deltaproteobacteria bacterium]